MQVCIGQLGCWSWFWRGPPCFEGHDDVWATGDTMGAPSSRDRAIPKWFYLSHPDDQPKPDHQTGTKPQKTGEALSCFGRLTNFRRYPLIGAPSEHFAFICLPDIFPFQPVPFSLVYVSDGILLGSIRQDLDCIQCATRISTRLPI